MGNFIKSLFIFAFSLGYLSLLRPLYTYSDEGIFTYGAIRILNGEILYKDFFASNAPLNYYLLAGLFKLFGANTEVTFWCYAIVGALTAVLIYIIAKEVNFSDLFSFLFVCFFIVSKSTTIIEYSHHWLSGLFSLLSILFFLKFIKNNIVESLFLSGLFAGITAGFFHPKGLFILIGILICLGIFPINQKGLSRIILLPLLSFSLPFIIFLSYFFIKDALGDFFYQLIFWPINNYSYLHQYPSYYYPTKLFLLEAIKQHKLFPNLLFALPPLFSGYIFFISTGIFFGVFLLKSKSLLRENKIETVFFILTFFMFFMTLYRPDDFRFAIISPVTNICLFLSVRILFLLLKPINNREWIKRIIIIFLLIIPCGEVVYKFTDTMDFKLRREKNYIEYKIPRGKLYFQIKELMDIEKFNEIKAEYGIKEIFFYPCSPSWYFLMDLRNPTRFDIILMRNLMS